jgi:ribosomal protein L15
MIYGFHNSTAQERDTVNKNDLSKLIEECDRLKPDEKAQLVKHLVANDSSLSVVVGGSQFHANTVYQINLADREQVGGILKAIADRIEVDPPS